MKFCFSFSIQFSSTTPPPSSPPPPSQPNMNFIIEKKVDKNEGVIFLSFFSHLCVIQKKIFLQRKPDTQLHAYMHIIQLFDVD